MTRAKPADVRERLQAATGIPPVWSPQRARAALRGRLTALAGLESADIVSAPNSTQERALAELIDLIVDSVAAQVAAGHVDRYGIPNPGLPRHVASTVAGELGAAALVAVVVASGRSSPRRDPGVPRDPRQVTEWSELDVVTQARRVVEELSEDFAEVICQVLADGAAARRPPACDD